MTEQREPNEELAFWRALAEERGRVIRALHEFNYWHESTVSQGVVVAGLERSVESWRERCLASEANADPVGGLDVRSPPAPPIPLSRRVLRRLRSRAGAARRALRSKLG